jgi:hypothetical protein
MVKKHRHNVMRGIEVLQRLIPLGSCCAAAHVQTACLRMARGGLLSDPCAADLRQIFFDPSAPARVRRDC